jgi:hypothetical protein
MKLDGKDQSYELDNKSKDLVKELVNERMRGNLRNNDEEFVKKVMELSEIV